MPRLARRYLSEEHNYQTATDEHGRPRGDETASRTLHDISLSHRYGHGTFRALRQRGLSSEQDRDGPADGDQEDREYREQHHPPSDPL